MKVLKSISVIVLLLFAACQPGTSQQLDVDKFETKLSQSPNAQVIDVRTPDEFSGGHLVNAQNINVDGGSFKQDIAKLDKNKPVFVYCLAGGRSANAAAILKAEGFKEVYDMKGGFRAWSGAGKPVDTGMGIVAPAAAKTGGMTKKDLEKKLEGKRFTIVDFNAKWCGPCKKISPVLDKIQTEMGDKVQIIKIDTDENPTVSDEFNIESLPTLLFFNGTKQIGQTLGWFNEAKLRADIANFDSQAK